MNESQRCSLQAFGAVFTAVDLGEMRVRRIVGAHGVMADKLL
jgi:hypothetical protein